MATAITKSIKPKFFNEVGAFSGLNRGSLVLQQKTGYSLVYRIWQELKFYLDLFGGQSNVSMKSVAEIYEVWCFLCLKQILEHDLGFELTHSGQAKLALNAFFEYQMTDGFAGAFEFKRSDGVTARLAHEPKFTKKGQPIRSYLVSQEPDIVLEVTLPPSKSQPAGKQFIWLFDAKYRIKNDPSRFDDDNIDGIDYVPDDAINQMHRYRDALIRLSSTARANSQGDGEHPKKSRPVFGAFALYPGFFDQAKEVNPYAEAIAEIGIGAFALLPNEVAQFDVANPPVCGHAWLLAFLQSQIGPKPDLASDYSFGDMAEHLYVQEPARIPYADMQQVLYPDLTMTVALGTAEGRAVDYFTKFVDGSLGFYHMPVSTFELKFEQHIANEIRYLAMLPDYQNACSLTKIWPVRSVSVMARNAIDVAVTGKASASEQRYFVFTLGKPLSLTSSVFYQPDGTFRKSIKLTTLSQLEHVSLFEDIPQVYQDVLI